MIKNLIKKLALRYTDLTYPIDTENVTLVGLDTYIKLHKLVTDEDFYEQGFIPVSKEFIEEYGSLIQPLPDLYTDEGAILSGYGFKDYRYKYIKLIEIK